MAPLRSPDWQSALDEYREYRSTSFSDTTTTQLVDRATRPFNFASEMSRAEFGKGPYFRTDQGDGGQRPVPYPPRCVWCVLLRHELSPGDDQTGQSMYTVVFVAEHHDLYNADILVHEAVSDPSSPALWQNLSTIGCEELLERLSQPRASWGG